MRLVVIVACCLTESNESMYTLSILFLFLFFVLQQCIYYQMTRINTSITINSTQLWLMHHFLAHQEQRSNCKCWAVTSHRYTFDLLLTNRIEKPMLRLNNDDFIYTLYRIVLYRQYARVCSLYFILTKLNNKRGTHFMRIIYKQ